MTHHCGVGAPEFDTFGQILALGRTKKRAPKRSFLGEPEPEGQRHSDGAKRAGKVAVAVGAGEITVATVAE